MRKTLLKYVLIIGFFFLIGFFKTYHLPDLKLWAINQIELTTSQGPARVLVSDIDFKFFPIGIHFNNIRIYPQKELEAALEPIYLKSFQISLNPLSFLTGLFQFSRIEFIEPHLKIKSAQKLEALIKNNSNKKTNFDLKKILRIPLNNFTIRNMELISPYDEKFPNLQLRRFSIDVENQRNSLLISLLAPEFILYDPKISAYPASVSLGGRLLVFEDQIVLSALKIKKGNSSILASGYLESSLNNFQLENYLLKVKTNFDLKDLQQEIKPFLNSLEAANYPDVEGQNQSIFTLSKKPQSNLNVDYKFKFQNLKIDQFYVGQAIGKIIYQNDQLLSDEIEVKNEAGVIRLKKINFQLKPENRFKVILETKELKLQELLKNLGLGEIPVQVKISSILPCEGDLKSKSLIACQGALDLAQFKVYSPTSTIAEFEKGQVNGAVEVTPEAVNIQSQITLGEKTKGTASGSVSYKDGFLFDYASEEFHFSDSNIANLSFEGTSKFKGRTQGDSHSAIFNFNIKALDFGISSFFVGDLSTKLSFKTGVLNLAEIDGVVRATKYLGALQIDLNKMTLQGDVKSPYIELSDLKKVFIKKTQLPFEFYGGGEAKVQFSGPLDFPHLSYKFSSQFLNGNIANESFDKLIFEATSKKGFVSIQEAQIKKGSGSLTISGTANPQGLIDTQWLGKNFTLQAINNFSKTELNMDANLDFNLNLKGPILAPDSLFKGRLENTTISQEKVPDSQFELVFKKASIDGKGKIFGDQIVADFKIPTSPETPFYLNAQFRKWDFVPLIHLISSKSRAAEFSTSLTADIQIESQRDFLWNANGITRIQELLIQRGTKQLKMVQPTSIEHKKGQINIQRLILTGDNTSLDIQSSIPSKAPIDISLNGKIDLGLLSFLTPFFEDLKGTAALTTQFSMGKTDWSLFGSAFVSNGYIRVADFLHSIDNFETDLLFSDEKIIVNKFYSQFANGRVDANGTVEIKGRQNITTDLYGKFKDLQLQVPKDIHTKGSGDFRVTGSWFPYLLEGNYIVQSGLIRKDFAGAEQAGTSYSRTQLLPKELSKEIKEVIILNMDTVFSKGIDIKNELMNSKIYGKLKIKGPPSNAILLGQIQLQKNSKIYFKDTEFEVEIGDLKFNDINKLNPELYISANTTVIENLDTTSQRYEINMLIQGRANNPTINLTSNPPRSDKDIISLLALGITTESYQTNSEENQFAKQSYEVGASILTKNKFGRDLKERTGFEFKVSSALDQTNNSAAPKITISKQWTPRVETSASRTFGESTTNDLKVEYQLNKNVSLIGSWEGRELSNTNLNKDSNDKTTTDILGLDIEYKLEFK